jgi:beta,beta-carotene 9',10'-dioxygenase
MLYSFTFENGRVSYRNRFIKSKAHRQNKETGEIKFSEFGTNHHQSLFSRLSTAFDTPLLGGNANVNVARFGDLFVALTETPLAMVFDRHTLETLGTFDYDKTDAQLSTAHPQFDVTRRIPLGRRSRPLIRLSKAAVSSSIRSANWQMSSPAVVVV